MSSTPPPPPGPDVPSPPPPPPGPSTPLTPPGPPAALTPPGPPAPLTPPGPPGPPPAPPGGYGAPHPGAAPGGYPAPAAPYGAPGPAAVPAWGAPPPTKKRSRAALVSVLTVVVLALLGVGAYLALSAANGTEPLEADVAESVEAHAQQVVVGNCLEELPDDGDVDTVTVVPCDTEHEAQVISAKKFSKDADFPGAKEAQSQSTEACTLDAIADQDVWPSTPALSVWAPTEESWEQGDRQGLCIVTVDGGLSTTLLR